MIDPASRIRRVLLASDAVADPLAAIAMAPGEPAFYWRSDQRDVEIAALGAVAAIDAAGPARFDDAAAALAALRPGIDDGAPGLPLAVGGFAFDHGDPGATWRGFPALRFFVPRVLWVRSGGRRRLVVAYPAGRGQTPLALLPSSLDERAAAGETGRGAEKGPDAAEQGAWRHRVEAATAAIRDGGLGKVVLARRRTVDVDGDLPVATLLGELAEARPSCFTFLLRWSGRTFVGSSPERLVRVGGDTVECDALAGTAPRAAGAPRDEQHARELLASAKERREHRFVVDAIRDALAPRCASVHVPDEPQLMALPEAWHLHTAVRGTMAHGPRAGLLDLAAALHPTPAVCGSPRRVACERLAVEEPDRGWYAGGVGWITGDGDGELAVALRAALLDENAAHVWAGAGIVEGSSAEREWEETERKMRSILPWLDHRADERAA